MSSNTGGGGFMKARSLLGNKRRCLLCHENACAVCQNGGGGWMMDVFFK
jgi:hypothetical protein